MLTSSRRMKSIQSFLFSKLVSKYIVYNQKMYLCHLADRKPSPVTRWTWYEADNKDAERSFSSCHVSQIHLRMRENGLLDCRRFEDYAEVA